MLTFFKILLLKAQICPSGEILGDLATLLLRTVSYISFHLLRYILNQFTGLGAHGVYGSKPGTTQLHKPQPSRIICYKDIQLQCGL